MPQLRYRTRWPDSNITVWYHSLHTGPDVISLRWTVQWSAIILDWWVEHSNLWICSPHRLVCFGTYFGLRKIGCQKRTLQNKGPLLLCRWTILTIRDRSREDCFKCDHKTYSPWFLINPKEVAGSISKADSIFLFCITITSMCNVHIVNPIMIDVQSLVKIWDSIPCILKNIKSFMALKKEITVTSGGLQKL